MAGEAEKLRASVSNAPLGALAGAIVGYLIAKKLGYEKTVSVVSFTVVGLIIGSALGYGVREKIKT